MLGASLTWCLETVTCKLSGPIVIPASGTKEMAADQAFLDRAEHRLVRFDVHVDVLELADPFSVPVDECLAVPFADVLVVGQCGSPPRKRGA